MPQALLLPPQTLWERVRGLRPSYEDRTPTPWKLADMRNRRRIVPDVRWHRRRPHLPRQLQRPTLE